MLYDNWSELYLVFLYWIRTPLEGAQVAALEILQLYPVTGLSKVDRHVKTEESLNTRDPRVSI